MDVFDLVARLRSTLAAHQLSAGTQIWRQQSEASILTDVARQQAAELVRYSLALAPILRHASGSDLSPPLRLSIQETRRIKEEVERG